MGSDGTRRTHIGGSGGLAPLGARRAASGTAHRQWGNRSRPAVPDEPVSRRRYTHQRVDDTHLRDRWGGWMVDHPGTPSVGYSLLRPCVAVGQRPKRRTREVWMALVLGSSLVEADPRGPRAGSIRGEADRRGDGGHLTCKTCCS